MAQARRGGAMGLSVTIRGFSFVASVWTFVAGVISIIALITDDSTLPNAIWCDGFFDNSCNANMKAVWTFNPLILLDKWTPVIMGILMTGFYVEALEVEQLKPRGMAQLAL